MKSAHIGETFLIKGNLRKVDLQGNYVSLRWQYRGKMNDVTLKK